MTDVKLRSYLEKKAEEIHDTIKLPSFDALVKKNMRMDILNSDALSRMKNLFLDYQKLLRKHGLIWMVEEEQEKVPVKHVISEIRPEKLRTRLESDISFTHHPLKKNFT